MFVNITKKNEKKKNTSINEQNVLRLSIKYNFYEKPVTTHQYHIFIEYLEYY